MATYATVEDYRVRTDGACLDQATADRLSALLADASDLFAAYLGPLESSVATAYPGVLRSLVIARVRRGEGARSTAGVRSQTIGPYSVSYSESNGLDASEMSVLDLLLGGGKRNLVSIAYNYE